MHSCSFMQAHTAFCLLRRTLDLPAGKSRGKVSTLCLRVGICSSWASGLLMAVLKCCWRSSPAPALSRSVLPAFVLKLILEEDEKVMGRNQRYCYIIAERTWGNANSKRKRWWICCCLFVAAFLWEFKRKWILLKWPFLHLLLALKKPVLSEPSTQTHK